MIRWPFAVMCLRMQHDRRGRENLDLHIGAVARGTRSLWWMSLRDGLWLRAGDPW